MWNIPQSEIEQAIIEIQEQIERLEDRIHRWDWIDEETYQACLEDLADLQARLPTK